MKTYLKLVLIIPSVLCFSCGVERVYTSGSYGSLKSYTAKQAYYGENSSAYYVTGAVSTGMHPQDGKRFKDSKTLLSVKGHKSITRKRYNLFYGAGVTHGVYTFKEGFEALIANQEKRKFWNLNFKLGGNYTMSRRFIDYRFIGVELNAHNEFGSYQKKLAELKNMDRSELLILNKKSMISYTMYSEYVFKIPEKNELCVGVFIGDLLSNIDEKVARGYDANFGGLSFGFTHDKYTFSLITQKGERDIVSTKFGLAYQF